MWNDLVFAAPIIAATQLVGMWPTFVAFSLLYAAGSFALALTVVRVYERGVRGRESRLAAWVEAASLHRRGQWGRRLLATGRLVGFVLASVVVGAVVTIWFIRFSGRGEGLARLAAASSAIFAVSFTAMYCGVAALLFGW